MLDFFFTDDWNDKIATLLILTVLWSRLHFVLLFSVSWLRPCDHFIVFLFQSLYSKV